MALTIEPLTREFRYGGIRLPDIASSMTVEEVKASYALTYPELATAAVEGPEAAGNKLRYTFIRAVGSKG